MRRISSLIFVIAYSLSQAQTGRAFPTIEGIVGGSEQVYSGWIESVSAAEGNPRYGPKKYHFKVHVVDTFKGPTRETLEFDLTTYFTSQMLYDFSDQKEMFLWMSPSKDFQTGINLLSKMSSQGDHPAFQWFHLYERDLTTRIVDYDSKIFTSDLRVISTWADLVTEVRRFLKVHPETVGTVEVTFPHSVIQMCGDPNAYGVVLTAKTPEFFEFAKRLEKDPKRVIGRCAAKSRSLYRKPKLTEEDVAQIREQLKKVLGPQG